MSRTDGLPPDWCLQPDDLGRLPTCTNAGGEWHRSFEGGTSDGTGGVAALMALILVLGIVATAAAAYWRVSTARRMARSSGIDEVDATRMALFTDGGLETTYLASTMRRRDEPPPAQPAQPDVAGRLRRLDDLRDQDLLTPQEYDERRRAILDDL